MPTATMNWKPWSLDLEKTKEFSCCSTGQEIVKAVVGRWTGDPLNPMNLHFGYSRCPDCVAAEKPIEETVRSSLPANGVFIECSVGDRTRSGENFATFDRNQWSSLTSWKDSNSLFRKDSKLRLTSIPTLVEWGTVRDWRDQRLDVFNAFSAE